MNRLLRQALLASTLVAAPGLAPRCLASVDSWEFEVYPYNTLPRGMAEFETDNAYVSSGHADGADGLSNGTVASSHTLYNAYEFTYGLTDRIEAAIYLNMARPPGSGLQWAGDNFRLRGRLFDEETLPVDVGWYLEFEWHKVPGYDNAAREIEFRPILEKDLGPWSLMANPKFEKVLAGAGHSHGFEFGYVAGIHYRLDKRFSPGVEFYGATGLINQADPASSQQHYIFPTIWGQLPGGLEYNAGVGFGLTRGSDHVVFKINLELEEFIGAVVKKASSDTGWFF